MIDVATYIVTLRPTAGADSVLLPSKKRRLNGDSDGSERKIMSNNGTIDERMSSEWHNSLRIPDVSFSIPQRKKLSLEISAENKEGIRAVNPKTGTKEFYIPWTEIGT